jgi:DNA-binding transcriptional ArsR family regulator
MTNEELSESLLPAIDTSLDSTMTEAFNVLGNETRLTILLVLWDVSKPGIESSGLSFSNLRERVGVEDSGQFNYHLDKLTGRFIKRTDEGYTLRQTGESIVKTVIREAGFGSPTVETTEIDLPCPHCDGQTAVRYENDWLYHVCTECRGTYTNDDVPEGCLSAHCLAPAACANRTPQELYALALFRLLQKVHQEMKGICPSCTGPVEQTLEICQEHDASGNCDTCGQPDPIRASFECLICKEYATDIPLTYCLVFHPAVDSFYYDHGIILQPDFSEFTNVHRIYELLDSKVELLTDDPVRARIMIAHDDEVLLLTLDGGLQVTEIHDSGKPAHHDGIQA